MWLNGLNWKDERVSGWMEVRSEGLMDGWMDGWMDGFRDRRWEGEE